MHSSNELTSFSNTSESGSKSKEIDRLSKFDVCFTVKNNSGVTPAGQCGTWVKEPDGGYFTSPNYPDKYPPERECVYIIEGEAFYHFLLPVPPRHHFIFSQPPLLLQPHLDSASTCSLITSIPSNHPGNVNSTTLRFAMGPLASHHSSVATADRKAQLTSDPVGGTCTSSLWQMVN